MQIYHNSRGSLYRSPLGAVKTGETVRLAIEVSDADTVTGVRLRLWIDDKESFLDMEKSGGGLTGEFYYTELNVPDSPCLVWYYFVISTKNGDIYYSNNSGMYGGVGEMTENATGRSYQITVYDRGFKTPAWFKNSVMYQIFPDRFCPDRKFYEIPRKRCEYTIHEDWYEPLSHNMHPFENGPACNDFYGGSLKGIASKLGYLKELGISTIYLNPIFEAYSNHRYDTGDYSKIDPILGTEEDFAELCRAAAENGIGIILDGVFSHTGSDSVYFNKYGNYGENTGAYRDVNSPYRSWYKWMADGGYESWWGCSNLPNVNETEPTYIDRILRSDDAIIKKWLRLGALGWRLDVADELPDSFIKTLRENVKSENPDAVIIGEVWEDASNKVSYGEKREYLFGGELDSVMNYPFKDGVIDFLMGHIKAAELGERMLSLMENYPKEAMYAAMNIVGTHDTARIKTVLGGQFSHDGMSEAEKQSLRLPPHAETVAIERVRLAAFMQMTFVGVPCIYYGDEIGMQGLGDPYNRMPYTWRCVDCETLDFYKRLTRLRNDNPCLRTGAFIQLFADGDVYAYARETVGGKDVFGEKSENGCMICIINCGDGDARVRIDLAPCVTEIKSLCGIIGGGEIAPEHGKAEVRLAPRSAEMFRARTK